MGVPFLAETAGGAVSANEKARQALGSLPVTGLLQAVERVAGTTVEPVSFMKQVLRAREGKHGEVPLGAERRILLMPAGDGRACAVLVEGNPVPTTTGVRRKAESDRAKAGMSHELANALGTITGWARLAKKGVRVEEALGLIEKAASTAWIIARQMHGHDETGPAGERPVTDFSTFVQEAVRLLAPKAAQNGVTVESDIAPGLRVRGSRDEVWSVVWNPMTNAVEAMPRGGAVRIEVTRDGNRIRFTVKDEGPGIDESLRERVFQPYFTTKQKGTGLGLSLVKQTVEEMGGSIELSSARGEGTTFRIDLPGATETERRDGEPHRVNEWKSGVFYNEPIRARILVVDDNADLRQMMETALETRGALVTSAATYAEAIEINAGFDLALIDMRLPDQSGDALLSRLRADGKVDAGLIVTGSETLPELVPGGEPNGVLRKPFQIEELFERVHQVLGTGREYAAS
jgi:nitrogen-specific signal transduction histidine kinase/CheY-like chemotaxis protein